MARARPSTHLRSGRGSFPVTARPVRMELKGSGMRLTGKNQASVWLERYSLIQQLTQLRR